MAGEEEYDPNNLKPDEFHAKNRGQKIFILFMGPAMNLLLAFFLFTLINITGVNVEAYKKDPPRIGYVEKASPAEKAGIKPGDFIRKIDGHTIADWKDLELTVGSNPNSKLDIEIERNGKIIKEKLDIKSVSSYNVGDAGFYWNFKTEILEVVKGKPAYNAKLKEGDVLESINGKKMTYFEISDFIFQGAGKKLSFNVRREKKEISIDIVPKTVYFFQSVPMNTMDEAKKKLREIKKKFPKLKLYIMRKFGTFRVFSEDMDTSKPEAPYHGFLTLGNKGIIGVSMVPYSPVFKKHYGLFPAMGKSVDDIVRLTGMVFSSFKKMIVGKLSPKNLSGPIEIAKFSQRALESGLSNFFMLIAFISLQLGIVNLFPIPALDGGHLIIFSIEAIIRKDFSQKVKGILLNIGFALLIALMVFVILNDIAKTLPDGWRSFFNWLPFL